MIDYRLKLLPGHTYHIYSRANGKEAIFFTDANYNYFLNKYKHYIYPIAETYCYCLMPNHFHFLVQFRAEKELVKLIEKDNTDASAFISTQFQYFLGSYTKAFNKQNARKGSLFIHPFRRKHVRDNDYFRNLIRYIHHNPIVAELCKKPDEWQYSSFNAIVKESHSLIQKKTVLDAFENLENFNYVHQQSLMSFESSFD
jgi:putative transposase